MPLLETRDMQATIVKQLLGEQDDTNLDKHRYINRLIEIADLESAEAFPGFGTNSAKL